MLTKYFRGERTVKLVAYCLYYRLISNVTLGFNGDCIGNRSREAFSSWSDAFFGNDRLVNNMSIVKSLGGGGGGVFSEKIGMQAIS